MLAGAIYPFLAEFLEEWRLRSMPELVARIGKLPQASTALVQGDAVTFEVAVRWTDSRRKSLVIEAVAYGPSHWLTQRFAERVSIPLLQEPGDAGL
jgi:hypothetical protein